MAKNQIPGDPEVWLVDGQAYIVYIYDFDFIDGEMPVAFKVTDKDLKGMFTGSVKYDKTVTMRQFNAAGALDFGTYDHPATQFDTDPMTQWMENFETEANVRPWLNDPEVASVYLAAYLQGRDPTDAEFENTEWWRTHNKAQRDWLLISESDPSTAAQMKADARLEVAAMMRAAGTDDPSQGLVNWITDQYIQGNWSQSYLAQQVTRLGDKWAPGKIDKELRGFLDGRRPNQTREAEDVVKELYDTWLGPMHGKVGGATIAQWAGQLRNDPDAEKQLIAQLQQRRLTLFPEYTDPNTTYDDIAGLWRQDWINTVGHTPDEVNDKHWINVLRTNDVEQAGTKMTNIAINRGEKTVVDDAIRTTAQAFGVTRSPI